MAAESIPIRQLPFKLKAVIGLLALHALIYAKDVIVAAMEGKHIFLLWVIHILLCLYLAGRVTKKSKAIFFILVLYCLVIPTNMLRVDYVAGNGMDELLSLTLTLCLPLYLAGALVIWGRQFYFPPMPTPSIKPEAAQ